MNTKFFATALVAAAAFAAAPGFAADNISGEVGYVPPAPVASASGLSRATVQDEARQAVRSFTLPATGEGYDVGAVTPSKSTLTREQVRAEARYAVKNSRFLGGEV
ncbi:hypothetical protein [Pseudorhodoferax sp. Leaf267]|uniref:hypothetical protein n=1 Tax=Pseudorhodoferax sp. Leaf267 TaxID=1736316 RepID=UPI0012E2DD37|nr:hypothetical protein [Pseudorhodoferax sp. Leaf267]